MRRAISMSSVREWAKSQREQCEQHEGRGKTRTGYAVVDTDQRDVVQERERPGDESKHLKRAAHARSWSRRVCRVS